MESGSGSWSTSGSNGSNGEEGESEEDVDDVVEIVYDSPPWRCSGDVSLPLLVRSREVFWARFMQEV